MATTITLQSRRQDKLQDHPEVLVALFNLGRSWAEHVITSDFGPFENMAAFGAVWTELLSGDCEIIELLRELNRPERDYDEALKMVVRAGYDLLPDELLTYNNR